MVCLVRGALAKEGSFRPQGHGDLFCSTFCLVGLWRGQLLMDPYVM